MACCLLLGSRWERASWTDHKSIDEVVIRNVVVLDVYKFVSFLQLGFLLQYPRKVSVINAKVTKMNVRELISPILSALFQILKSPTWSVISSCYSKKRKKKNMN